MSKPTLDAASPRFTELLAACPIVPGTIVSKPLLNLPEGRVVVFAMDAGQEMSEHRASSTAVVQVLEGKLRFRVQGQERIMLAHDWLVMPRDAAHDLSALEPTRFLLTMLRKPEST